MLAVLANGLLEFDRAGAGVLLIAAVAAQAAATTAGSTFA